VCKIICDSPSIFHLNMTLRLLKVMEDIFTFSYERSKMADLIKNVFN
jgi:hypothetical protein